MVDFRELVGFNGSLRGLIDDVRSRSNVALGNKETGSHISRSSGESKDSSVAWVSVAF
jgi:hypothetical protein